MENCASYLGLKRILGKLNFMENGKYEACNNFENLKLWESRKF